MNAMKKLLEKKYIKEKQNTANFVCIVDFDLYAFIPSSLKGFAKNNKNKINRILVKMWNRE